MQATCGGESCVMGECLIQEGVHGGKGHVAEGKLLLRCTRQSGDLTLEDGLKLGGGVFVENGTATGERDAAATTTVGSDHQQDKEKNAGQEKISSVN